MCLIFICLEDVEQYIKKYKEKNNGIDPTIYARIKNGKIEYRTKIW